MIRQAASSLLSKSVVVTSKNSVLISRSSSNQVLLLLTKRSFGTQCSTNLLASNGRKIDVFPAISSTPFPEHVASILRAPLQDVDIEVLPEGSLFLPEIKVGLF